MAACGAATFSTYNWEGSLLDSCFVWWIMMYQRRGRISMATLTDDSWVVGAIDVPKLLGDDPDGWQSLIGLMICRENLVLCKIGHVQARRGLPFLITVSGCDGEFRTNSEYLNAFAYLVFPDPDRAHHLLRASLDTIVGRANQEAARQRKESQDRIVALINRRIRESSIRQVRHYWINPVDLNVYDWWLLRILPELDAARDLESSDIKYLELKKHFGALAVYYRNIENFSEEAWWISRLCSFLRGTGDPRTKKDEDLRDAIFLTSNWIDSAASKQSASRPASAVWTSRGAAFLDRNMMDDAKECADTALDINETHHPHNLLGRYYFKLQQIETGVKHFGLAQALDAKGCETRSAILSALRWDVPDSMRQQAKKALERIEDRRLISRPELPNGEDVPF